MSRFRYSQKPSLLTDSSLMCFTVAAVAFLAAAVGIVVNYFLVGWMAVGGMFAVGLLYVALGLFSLASKEPALTTADHEGYDHNLPGGSWRPEVLGDITTAAKGAPAHAIPAPAAKEALAQTRN